MSKQFNQRIDIVQEIVNYLSEERSNLLRFLEINAAPVKRIAELSLPELNRGNLGCLLELEDDSFIHIEFQQHYNKDELIRFWEYDTHTLNRYSKHSEVSFTIPNLRTVVIYGDKEKDDNNELILDFGAVTYEVEVRYLSDYINDDSLNELLTRISNDTKINLEAEEVFSLVFGSLTTQQSEVINERVDNIVLTVNKIENANQKFTLLSVIYTLTSAIISSNTKQKFKELLENC